MHDLLSFCMVLSIIFLAFLHTGILVFGPSIGRGELLAGLCFPAGDNSWQSEGSTYKGTG